MEVPAWYRAERELLDSSAALQRRVRSQRKLLIRVLLALRLGCADIAKIRVTEEPEHQLRRFPEPLQGAKCFVA